MNEDQYKEKFDAVMALSEEDLWEKVAEAVGWTNIRCLAPSCISLGEKDGGETEKVPDYTSDLNAINKIEWEMSGQHEEYHLQFLVEVMHARHKLPILTSWVVRADAIDRCRALLLWKEIK